MFIFDSIWRVPADDPASSDAALMAFATVEEHLVEVYRTCKEVCGSAQ
jgi:hypothetical protein